MCLNNLKNNFTFKIWVLKENIIILFLNVCVKRYPNPKFLLNISIVGYWDLQHLFWKLLVERCINNLEKI